MLTSASVYAELNSLLGIRIATAVGVDTFDEVVLERGDLAEAQVHVCLGAVQRRVLSDDILETLDLLRFLLAS